MYKIGIVGAGIIGQSHSDCILKNPDCVLTAVCDTVIERAEEIASLHGAKCFTDYKQMPGNVELDAVILNLPHFLHCEATVFFLEKGVHVLVEKPMAMNVEECEKMIEAAKRSGSKLAVGHVQRYYSSYDEIKKLIKDNTYGKLCMISETRNINYLPNRPKWFLNKELSGGGIIMNYGAHTLDKIMYVTEDTVEETHAYFGNPLSDDNVEINAQILLKMKSGITANITYCGCPGVNYYETVFYFEQGVAKVYGGPILLLSKNGAFEETRGTDDIMGDQLAEFVEFLNDNENRVATPEFSKEIIRVLEKILKV